MLKDLKECSQDHKCRNQFQKGLRTERLGNIRYNWVKEHSCGIFELLNSRPDKWAQYYGLFIIATHSEK